jgi:ankyrin repeat protein
MTLRIRLSGVTALARTTGKRIGILRTFLPGRFCIRKSDIKMRSKRDLSLVGSIALFLALFAGCRHIDSVSLDKKLIESAKDGDAGMVMKLLDQGANIGARNESQRTVLMLAALKSRAEIVQLLISRGAKVDDVDSQRMTALMWASFGGSKAAVEALIAHGADICARDANGESALDWARARSGNTSVIELLKGKNAGVP